MPPKVTNMFQYYHKDKIFSIEIKGKNIDALKRIKSICQDGVNSKLGYKYFIK